MKIAIHQHDGSYSDRWIKYCQENNIPFKIVNCYDSDIITQLSDCQGLMWHWDLNEYKAALLAKQLTYSLTEIGIKVFPDIDTGWHYNDKVGQKYLLESIDAPIVQSYIFYSKHDALKWITKASFPKVFKLRNGAGSSNVRLVKNKHHAKRLVKKAFGTGFSHISTFQRLKERFYMFRRDKNIAAFKKVLGGFVRLFVYTEVEKFSQIEKGYVYFQDFIKDNDFDTRLVVIGDRCFGARRYNRKGDFRASGSGILAYEKELIDTRIIKIAFNVSERLNVQSLAFDFIFDKNMPKIIEISYCFGVSKSWDAFLGYWDRNLNWHEEKINPQVLMIENFIKSLQSCDE